MNIEPKFNPIENATLSSELKKSILKYIGESTKLGLYKLPSEVNISNNLGVSRLALREVFKELRNDGILYSIHGKGTYINKNFTNLKFRLTPAREFLKSIYACGYEASVEVVDYNITESKTYDAKSLELNTGDKLLNIYKVFFADNKPVIFCIDTIPFKYFKDVEISQDDLNISTFDYIKNKANIIVENDIVEMTAVLADEIPSEFDSYKSKVINKPLIKMASVYYTLTQEPVMQVKAFFDTENIKLSQLRKQNVYDDYL